MEDLEFEESFHRVLIETKAFRAEAYELYELPSMKVIDMLTLEGPDQMFEMREMLKIALVYPSDVAKLDALSFNELASAMMQWYQRSTIRIEQNKNRSIADILAEAIIGGESLVELFGDDEEPKRRFSKPLNDPGDGIDPLG